MELYFLIFTSWATYKQMYILNKQTQSGLALTVVFSIADLFQMKRVESSRWWGL